MPSRISDQTATNSGPADCSSSVFSAVVCSSDPVLQAGEGADPDDGEKDHGAEMAADRPPVAPQMLPGEGENDKQRQRPAQERQRHRRNMPGGEAADDGVAGPAQRGDREQQIGLIGEPVAGGGGAGGVI
jgi:hypothetical protein